ncbi:MerR family transcriptional regulator [Bacillus massiliigorillae]|uniref:MerR family transcriptional regulator n=1 Tax=Bacillus massiliigorillae TaxID=1243664 RepID=UPI0003A010CF|nr:MerR family transcriptional regulator [Bacillus massiliigorillae]
MQIGEISKLCKLTKKAISYYEQVGLIDKKYDSNGYRMYDETDVTILKEIYILRKLGMSVSDIKSVFESDDKQLALRNYQDKQVFQIEQAKAQQHYLLRYLNQNLSVEDAFQEIEHKLDHHMIIKDKLLQAFPGVYGKYLYVHFGRFLNGTLDSVEKIKAFNNIVEYLDNLNSLDFEKDIQRYLEEQMDMLNMADFNKMDEGFHEVLKNYDEFIGKNKESLEWYLEYRNSEEFKSSPAYKMQLMLKEFHKNNGYYDVFIENVKILSESYKTYNEQLQKINDRLLEDFPQAKKLDNEMETNNE